jgi:hypothetical protein
LQGRKSRVFFLTAQKIGSQILLLKGFLLPGKVMAFVLTQNRRKAIYGLILTKYVLLNILPGIPSIDFFITTR